MTGILWMRENVTADSWILASLLLLNAADGRLPCVVLMRNVPRRIPGRPGAVKGGTFMITVRKRNEGTEGSSSLVKLSDDELVDVAGGYGTVTHLGDGIYELTYGCDGCSEHDA